MNSASESSKVLRAAVRLSRHEIAHLWNGGILSLEVGAAGMEADLELRCAEAQAERATGILIKRVGAE